MGVRILYDGERTAALYCSTTEWAFGPLFNDDGTHDAVERAEAFCRWLGAREPRRMTDAELASAHMNWLAQEAEQWKAEEGTGFEEGTEDGFETSADFADFETETS